MFISQSDSNLIKLINLISTYYFLLISSNWLETSKQLFYQKFQDPLKFLGILHIKFFILSAFDMTDNKSSLQGQCKLLSFCVMLFYDGINYTAVFRHGDGLTFFALLLLFKNCLSGVQKQSRI